MFHPEHTGFLDEPLIVNEHDAWNISIKDVIFQAVLPLPGESKEQIDEEQVHPSVEDISDCLINPVLILELDV